MSAREIRSGGEGRMVVRFLDWRDHDRLRPGKVTRAEALQRRGTLFIGAGFGVSCAGILAYCVVCLAGGLDIELGEALLGRVLPLARLTLGVIGLGTASWLAGSFMYLIGALEADGDTGES